MTSEPTPRRVLGYENAALCVWDYGGPGTPLLLSQNYHLVHHLMPRVPFYRYGPLYRDLRPELERHGSTIVHLH